MTTPTTGGWAVVPYADPTKADPNQDQRTGQGEGDIVGGGYLPSIYMHYEGTAGSTTGTLYFRLRIGEEENPPGFSRAAFIFIDANGDGKMDLTLGVDNSGGGAAKIGIWNVGTGANTSPSTTSLISPPAVSYTGGSTNYDWSAVTTTIDPTAIAANVPAGVAPLNTDGRTGSGDHTDRFLTFAIPFADIYARLFAKGITINSSTPLRIVVETATQDNSLNQDIGGVDDASASFDPSATWETLGALTPPIAYGNVAPVNSLPAVASVAQNGTLAFSGAQMLSVADINYNLSKAQLTAVNGIVTVSKVGGAALNQASITAGANGSATLTISGTQGFINAALATLTFQPTASFTGAASVQLISTDQNVLTDTDTVAITVGNSPPVNTVPGTQTATEDTALSISGLSVSDSDGNLSTARLTVASGTLSVSLAGGAAISNGVNGTATLTLSGTQAQINAALATVSYLGNPNFNGTDSLTVLSTDAASATASSSVQINVAAVNDPPVAVNDSTTTAEDTSVTISVLGNDTDLDGNPLSVTDATVSAAQGSVVVNANGTLTFTPAVNFYGPATITYTISDGQGGTSSASVFVTVTAVNDPPVAVNDSASTAEDTTVTFSVLGNDSDLDGGTLSVTDATVPAVQGSVVVNANGTLTFTPAANFYGPATIAYTISDGQGGTASASVFVTVTAVNDPPVAVNDSASTAEDTVVTFSVLGNDSDPDGGTLSVTDATVPAVQGSVVVNANGTLIFTPAANFYGPATITYTISDGQGGTSSASVFVTVTAVNDPPVAINDSATTSEDTTVTFNVLGNDSDLDGDSLSVTGATVPAVQGSVVVNPNGTLTYIPAPDFNGPATIGYSISDGHDGTASASVAVSVTAINDPPVAVNDSATTPEDTAVTINVLGNDSDVDGDTLSVTGATVLPAQGNVVVNVNGTVTFTPALNFHGPATISYAITDGNESGANAVVDVNVTSVNDAPVAVNDTANATKDSPVTVAVLTNDSDVDGDPLTVATASVPEEQGTVVVNENGTITYTPAPGFTGTVLISYTINDGHGGTSGATVTVTVTAAPNTPPVAVNDAADTAAKTAVNISVLGNDTDADNDPLTVTAASVPEAEGTVTINANGTLTFSPADDFIGSAAISYSISDGRGGTASAIATVTVTAPANSAPVAVNDTFNLPGTLLAVLANDSDPDGQPLTITSFTQGAQGTVVLNANNTFTYSAGPGFVNSDTFTYTIDDGAEGSATATVTILNQAPVARADTQSIAPPTPAEIAVLANDSDPNGDTLSIASVTQGAHGTVTITGEGTTVTYTPGEEFGGSDSFNVTITDGHGGTATSRVTITSNISSAMTAGLYDGLLVNPEPTGPNGGYIIVKVSRTGAFTGTLYHAGYKMRLRGAFDANGDTTANVVRYDGVALHLAMHFDSAGPRIVGEVSHGENTSAILAELCPYKRSHPAPRVGRYSILLPSSNEPGTPEAMGYAVMQIQVNGVVSINGRTGDGTPIVSSTWLNADGNSFELYSGMYYKKERGSIFGTLRFGETPEIADFNGPLVWHKPPQTQTHSLQYRYYTAGFQTRLEAIGCNYVSTPGLPVLNTSLAVPNTYLELSGATLKSSIEQTLTLSAANVFAVVGANPNSITLTVNPTTGSIHGRFLKANGQRSDIFGTIYQKQNLGAGIFFNSHEIGTAAIFCNQPEPQPTLVR